MQSEKLNIDGIDIAYIRRGRGMSLILIHGYPLDHSIWDQVAPLLGDDFEMIIPDLRGFGGSDLVEADQSIIDYASDLAGIMTQLRVKKAVLAGHSMGGYVALAFAREYPERVSGLAMIASQVLADPPERKEGRYATAKQVLEEGVGPIVESMTPKLSADPAVQAFVRELISRQRSMAIASALRAMAERPDSAEMFAAFRFPVVIVHGDADALIPVERAREMKVALGSARYTELAAVGHMPMLEQPGAVAEALQFFVKVRLKGVKLLEP
jgi:pimeloyl-ACP methyl ester carboxylesterase